MNTDWDQATNVYAEAMARVARKAGMQTAAAAKPKDVVSDGHHAGGGYIEEPPTVVPPKKPVGLEPPGPDQPGSNPAPGVLARVDHVLSTANLWHEPVTWLAGALVLSAIVGAATTIYLHHASK